MKSKRVQKAIESMPPLSHYPDRTQPFSWSDSEVVRFITSRPEVQQYLFEHAKEKGFISFDSTTLKWVGGKWAENTKNKTFRPVRAEVGGKYL